VTDVPATVTELGRSDWSSAKVSSATTVRPSKMRSTATDEITVVNRAGASRAAV
jgi:hypothetical protein